jgi:phenylacetate-CoA ligase
LHIWKTRRQLPVCNFQIFTTGGDQIKGGELYLTGNNAVPLIRYGIGDHGGVQSYDAVEEMITARGMSIHDLLQEADSTSTLHKLPLVYVYERNDFSTTLYGLQIYPEVIREVLIRNPLQKFLVGALLLRYKIHVFFTAFQMYIHCWKDYTRD